MAANFLFSICILFVEDISIHRGWWMGCFDDKMKLCLASPKKSTLLMRLLEWTSPPDAHHKGHQDGGEHQRGRLQGRQHPRKPRRLLAWFGPTPWAGMSPCRREKRRSFRRTRMD